jgi:predicted phosphate transport protein (TIGR00153 family)
MRTFLNLFGRSPFTPLQTHMGKVRECVLKVPSLFDAIKDGNYDRLAILAEEISKLEHDADLVKNDIRNHLPNSLFLPIDRRQLLEILSLQDHIADRVEDLSVLLNLKRVVIPPQLQERMEQFVAINIETFEGACLIVKELHELLESSFGGIEAEKVSAMVQLVAYKEHEADLVQNALLKTLFGLEDQMSYGTFYLWIQATKAIAEISNLSEKLANRIRMTLELK